MIELEALETITTEKVVTKLPLDGRRVMSNMRPTRRGYLKDHFADLSSILHGLSDVCELAPVGDISKRHPLTIEMRPMNEISTEPGRLYDRILEVFRDGKSHRVSEVANALQEDPIRIGTNLPGMASRGLLARVSVGVYRKADGTPAAKPLPMTKTKPRESSKRKTSTPPHPAHENGLCTACWILEIAAKKVFPDVDLRNHLKHTPKELVLN